MVAASVVLAGLLAAAVAAPCSPGTPAPAQAPDPSLTLAAAIAQARTASPRRRSAALIVESTREAFSFAGRRPNPIFEFRTENLSASGRSLAPAPDTFAVVTQPLEIGGRAEIRRRLAGAEGEVAAAALRLVERELSLETVRVYIRALRARALVATLSINRNGLTMLLDRAARQVGEGYSAEIELLKFRTEAARVDGEVVRAQLELDRSLAALGSVMGASAPIRAAQLVEPPALPVPAADSGTVAARIAAHPGVYAATASVAVARQVAALERARRLPIPAISAGYKRTAGFDTAVLGVTLSVPLFDRNREAVARAAGLEGSAMADRDARVYQISADAASLVRSAETLAGHASRAARELVEPAEDVRRSTLSAFYEGAADILTVIDAERVYADAHRAAIDLRLDALLTTIEARFALGEEGIP